MKTTTILAGALAATLLAACGDDTSSKTPDAGKRPDAATPDAAPPDAPPPPPAPPALGPQIDRLGRPAINTALNRVFEAPTAAGHGEAKDAYNTAASPGSWASMFRAEIKKNAAILDSLDTVCGNAPGYAGPASMTSYDLEGSLLADDELYVNSAVGNCALFLGVELSVLINPAPPTTVTGCGGRAPSYDVIDFSYSALAAGLAGFDAMLKPKIKDGVDAHTGTNATSDTTFPFLAAPH